MRRQFIFLTQDNIYEPAQKKTDKMQKLSAPCQKILINMMTTFIDSELAISNGFATWLDLTPNITQRIHIARVIMEKAENAELVLNLMGSLDKNEQAYIERIKHFSSFDFASRVDRDVAIDDLAAHKKDHRLIIHHYPAKNWLDMVMLYVLHESAANILIHELSTIFYRPVANACRMVLLFDGRPACLAREELLNLAKIAGQNGKRGDVDACFDYWLPRARAVFEPKYFPYFEQLRSLGLPHRSSADMLNEFHNCVEELRNSLDIIMEL